MTKERAEPQSAEAAAAAELVRLAKQFTKTVLETALNEKLTDHLGHDKNQARRIGNR